MNIFSTEALVVSENIARIANAVQCHNKLSGNKDCHEYSFSIVRIVIRVSSVTCNQCLNCQVSGHKISTNLKIFKHGKNGHQKW